MAEAAERIRGYEDDAEVHKETLSECTRLTAGLEASTTENERLSGGEVVVYLLYFAYLYYLCYLNCFFICVLHRVQLNCNYVLEFFFFKYIFFKQYYE